MTIDQRLKALQTAVVPNISPSYYRNRYLRLVFTRRATELAVCTLLIFGGQQFFVQNHFYSALWPASGVALSALFLRGNFLILGIFLGSFASYALNSVSLLMSGLYSLLFTCCMFLIRYLSLRIIGPVTPLAHRAILVKFIVVVILLSGIHTGALCQVMPPYFQWLQSWLAEITGILCLTPLCLTFEPFAPQRYFTLKAWRWWLSAIILIGCYFLFYWVPAGAPSLWLSLIFFCGICAYAKAFGQIPLGITLLGISVVYLSGQSYPYHLFHLSTTAQDSLLLLACFTFTAMISFGIATRR